MLSRLFRRRVRHDDPPEDAPSPEPATDPVVHDQGVTTPGQWHQKPPGVREVHHYSVGPGSGGSHDWGYLLTIWLAGLLLVLLAAATMYVSFEAQYTYVGNFKNDVVAVFLEALSWDLAAVAFAILGMATALRGRSALTARLGNLACVAASTAMNLAQADMGDAGSVLVWAGPPLLYAGVSDRIIVEIQQRMVERRELPVGHTLWSVAGIVLGSGVGVLAWLLRLIFSPWRTITMFRRWYLDEIPYAPGRTLAGDRATEALEQAKHADQVRELAEQQATEQVEKMRNEFAERSAEQDKRHAEQVEKLEAELAELRAQAGADVNEVRERAEQQLAELREKQTAALEAEREQAARERAEREQRFQADLDHKQREAWEHAQRASELDEQVRALRTELDAMREAASGKQKLTWAYERLGRNNDSRFGRRECVREVARELMDEAGLASVNTAVNYLTQYLDEQDTQQHVNGHAIVGVGS